MTTNTLDMFDDEEGELTEQQLLHLVGKHAQRDWKAAVWLLQERHGYGTGKGVKADKLPLPPKLVVVHPK